MSNIDWRTLARREDVQLRVTFYDYDLNNNADKDELEAGGWNAALWRYEEVPRTRTSRRDWFEIASAWAHTAEGAIAKVLGS